jgi:broad specificity phosphatase PhoE
MKIILIRHFKVDFDWRFAYNSQDYENACCAYDKSAVRIGNLRINTNDRIYSSTLIRAVQTAEKVFNKLPDFYSDSLREIPIVPFMRTKEAIPRFIWNIIGRIQWRCNSQKQPETFLSSCSRIEKLVDSIIAQNENCYIIAHGFVIKLIIWKLKAANFKGLSPIIIKNGLPYEYTQ